MYFKKAILGVSLVCLTSQAGACYTAYSCPDYKSNFYLGADAQLRHMKFDKDYGGSVMRKNHKQGNIYMGFKLDDNWSIELGRESTFSKTKKVTLGEGQVVNGSPLTPELSPSTFLTTMKAKGPHFDVVFSKGILNPLPLNFIAGIGLSHITFKATRDNATFGTDALPGPSRSMKKGFLALRPMAGLQYNFDNGFSLRTTVSWVDTSGASAKALDSGTLKMHNRPIIYLKDSFVFGAGFLVNI